MNTPNLEFVPPELLPRLAKIRPYVLLLLTKGPHYFDADSRRILQSGHLPYTFQQRDEGAMVLTMPVYDNNSRIAAIAIYNGEQGCTYASRYHAWACRGAYAGPQVIHYKPAMWPALQSPSTLL